MKIIKFILITLMIIFGIATLFGGLCVGGNDGVIMLIVALVLIFGGLIWLNKITKSKGAV